MKKLSDKFRFAIGLFLFCCAYWMLDSAWSFLSFERNLSALVFQEPMSYTDTLLLKVSPYQVVSRIMVVVIFIVSGTVIAIFINKRNKAQEEKVRLERRLQQAHKMESLGTLAGGIAHDFNNILYGAMGYTELCLEDTQPDTLLHSNLLEILSGLQRAKSLVSQILAFSRQSPSEVEPTQVAPVVNEVLKLIRSTIPTTIKIRADTDVPNSSIMGDPTQIHQVVLNLCTNAAQAMAESGGTLKVTLDNVEIGTGMGESDDADFASGDYLKISVADTGEGIPPENLNRVFDPFFTSKEQGRGTGMGLAVVHGIVKSHHGRILVESFQGQGTTFDVYLPRLKNTPAPEDHQSNEHLPKGREHILIVDDRPQVVNMQQQLLERLGYTVSSKNSSREVVEAIKSNQQIYHAVITDMTMPEMTGDVLAGEIKKIIPTLPVILCTGYSEKISNTHAQLIGIDAFLMKPVSNVNLARTLRRVLDK